VVQVTIRKGEDWGVVGPRPDATIVVATDAQARAIVEPARRANREIPPLYLRGGDLARTVGAGPGVVRDETRLLPCDLGAAMLDGRLFWFVSSLVAGEPLRRGRSFVAMNAAWLGELNIAPKAHPNDGLLDTLDMTMSLTQGRQARKRARLGDHLPHPSITTLRAAAVQVELARPLPVRLDGEVIGSFRNISVRAEPDALTVVI
jgi:hypothetical protein